MQFSVGYGDFPLSFPIVDGKKFSPIGSTSSKNVKNVICLMISQLKGLKSVRAFKIELQIESLVLRRRVNRSAWRRKVENFHMTGTGLLTGK